MAVNYEITKDFTVRNMGGRRIGPSFKPGDEMPELPNYEIVRLSMAGCIRPIESAAYRGAPETKRRGRPRKG